MFVRCIIFLVLVSACGSQEFRELKGKQEGAGREYRWTKIVDSLPLATSANLQILNIRDTVWAIQPGALYHSIDGREFVLSNRRIHSSLAPSSNYIFFNNRLISITKRLTASGEEECICVESTDFKNWNVHQTSLPLQPSYEPIYFNSKLWLYTKSGSIENISRAWNSTDGMNWKLVADSLPLPLEGPHSLVVLRRKILLISSTSFESDDGMHWRSLQLPSPSSLSSRTILAFNDMIWLFGSSVSGNDSSSIHFSKDLKTWDSMPAPWTTRLNPAICIFRGRILLIGGRHPAPAKSQAGDSVLNDSWELSNLNKTIN